VLTNIQCRILKKISSTGRDFPDACGSEDRPRLAVLLGDEFLTRIAGKVIVDFGCGQGADALEMARRGANRVIGIDIREEVLQKASQKAVAKGVQDICLFASSTNVLADIVVSVDAFEHFADPADILRTMNTLLQPAGEVLVSFGPTWYHPYGGHLFSVFPWAHLLFSEKAFILWRSAFKSDGATRFSEIGGGLNKMTIARFEELIAGSPFKFASVELVAIKKLRPFHNRFTREFTTSVVRCRLVKRT
jgi:SAM-dependent methyltransferase